MAGDDVIRAEMWELYGRWHGRLVGSPSTVQRASREACLASLRKAAGRSATLTVEITPPIAGVAEAAAIMGWDKRRVITYLDRGSFPEPFAALASGRVWKREDVEAYAKAWHRRHARRNRSR